MKNYDQILKDVKVFAIKRIAEYPDTITYHNAFYANRLNRYIRDIGKAEGLNESDLKLGQICGWLISASFDKTVIVFEDCMISDNMEVVVPEVATEFFGERTGETDVLNSIIQVISKIWFDKNPQSTLERVLYDSITADFVHDSGAKLKAAYSELLLKNVEITKGNWYEVIGNMASKVSFQTDFGKENLQPKMNSILKSIKKDKKEMENLKTEVITKELDISEKEMNKLKKSLTKAKGRNDRAIQTLFRTTSKNHYTLNEMVDRKASIMITTNSIILSLVISGIIGRGELEHPVHYIPIAMLTLTSIISIIFAILSTRPNKTQGHFSEQEIRSKQGNLLYFGNFHNMKLRDYEWGMLQMLNDSDYLYSSMVRDLYFLGQTLNKKYKHIRIALNVFLIGFVISLLCFVIVRVTVHW